MSYNSKYCIYTVFELALSYRKYMLTQTQVHSVLCGGFRRPSESVCPDYRALQCRGTLDAADQSNWIASGEKHNNNKQKHTHTTGVTHRGGYTHPHTHARIFSLCSSTHTQYLDPGHIPTQAKTLRSPSLEVTWRKRGGEIGRAHV